MVPGPTTEPQAETTASPAADAGQSEGAVSGGGLRRLAVRGAAFEVIGYGSAQVLRLLSNVILTRLLAPQAFGLLAIIGVFQHGLAMLSDIGIEPAVVRSRRGDDTRFLDTAWTLQVMRGVGLFLIALAMAWPLAGFFHEPALPWLVAVSSVGVALSGLHSTALYTLRRRLQIGKLTMIELGSQVSAIAVMVPWACLWPSEWALVAGGLVAIAFKVVASWNLEVGYRNRFRIDPEARREIADFGKWIFAASAVYFLGRQGDRILLGKFMGAAELGIYAVALNLSESIAAVVQRVTHGVLYPAISKIQSEGVERTRHSYYKARLVLDAISLPALGALTVVGPAVVNLLYDPRYAAAGWMLQVLAIRVAMLSFVVPCETCLFSMGRTRFGLYQNIARLAWVAVGVPVGWNVAGLSGLVVAVGLSELPSFFVLWPALARSGVLRLPREALAMGMFASGVAVGLGLELLIDMVRP
jgi:O-antigen/teichoic acid export membrane protein